MPNFTYCSISLHPLKKILIISSPIFKIFPRKKISYIFFQKKANPKQISCTFSKKILPQFRDES